MENIKEAAGAASWTIAFLAAKSIWNRPARLSTDLRLKGFSQLPIQAKVMAKAVN